MIRIFTSIYPESNELRRTELNSCLVDHCSNEAIGQVCLLIEWGSDLACNHQKIITRSVNHRPTYADFIQWAKQFIASDDDITVICNSDIAFDESLAAVSDLIQPQDAITLSRWNEHRPGQYRVFDRNDSQDTWIFRGKIREFTADFLIGVPRCDNRMVYELRKAGYDVINPAFSLRSFHRHAGWRPEYPSEIEGAFVEPPYDYLWPHNWCSLPGTFLYRWRTGKPLGWRIDWRKFRQSLPLRVLAKLRTRNSCQ